jgi:hypothetical protein
MMGEVHLLPGTTFRTRPKRALTTLKGARF